MAYFGYHNAELTDAKGRILGAFKNKETNVLFEYSANTDVDHDFYRMIPHKIALDNGQFRYATVEKTVAYVIVDENEKGMPVYEKWFIKQHKKYGE
jgi:hypothetical protein